MKGAYPIIITKEGNDYLVNIPDFDIDTEGKDLYDAIFMARDAIGLMGIQLLDENKELPVPFSVKFEKGANDIETFVDVDFDEYRKRYDSRMVKKNCTIPYYLNVQAEKMGINFSRVLQDALLEKINSWFKV